MKYTGYKLVFPKGVHFGKQLIDGSDTAFHSDTLFSAICHEAKKCGEEQLGQILSWVKEGKLIFTDGMPFCDETLYVPKPMRKIEFEEQGDSSVKKAFKSLSYIPIDKIKEYMTGSLDIKEEKKKLDKLGIFYSRSMVAIRGKKEAEPFRVGVFQFNDGNGLYFIVGYEDDEKKYLFEDLLEGLSFSGIGGKRSSGLGRFELRNSKLSEDTLMRLKKDGSVYMTLSIALPKEQELEEVLQNSSYQMIKRSGFVVSENYADEYLRKKDLYVMNAGACFSGKFQGDVYDVSVGGNHSVYRYAKPFFMEVGV